MSGERFQFQLDPEQVRKGFEQMSAAMRNVAVSLKVGQSWAAHRHGDQLTAAQRLGELNQEERDAVHRWARWVLGDDLEEEPGITGCDGGPSDAPRFSG